MPLTKTLVAPGNQPFGQFGTRSGRTYTADANGLIAGVPYGPSYDPVPTDLADLLAAGCSDPSGNMGTFPLRSAVDGLVAHAGGGQGSATPIPAAIARFATVATAGDSALLPSAIAGMQVTVTNGGAASMNVFAKGSETINGSGSAFAVAAGKTAIFSCTTSGNWSPLLSA